MPPTHHRYAVYFAPNPGSLGWLAGSHWLGRCAALLQPLQQLAIDGMAADTLHRLTAAPRRYGWHATLKAPFALAPGTDWLMLHQTVQEVARGLQPFVLPPMQVKRIDDFLALVPPALHPANAQIQETAATCVTALQHLAAPLSDADVARRRAAGLTARQDALLQRLQQRSAAPQPVAAGQPAQAARVGCEIDRIAVVGGWHFRRVHRGQSSVSRGRPQTRRGPIRWACLPGPRSGSPPAARGVTWAGAAGRPLRGWAARR